MFTEKMETFKVKMEFISGQECTSGFVIICKILNINSDSKVRKISQGALIGCVYFTDEAKEVGNAVFL